MNKQEFLAQLRKGLSGISQAEIAERLTFYSEMIDDRMEEGLSEAEAVSGIGSLDSLIAQIRSDIPRKEPASKNATPKRKLTAFEIVLLVLGSPIWLSLLIAAFAVVLSLYVSLWSVVISLWAVFASVAACGVSGLLAGIGFAIWSNRFAGIAMIGAGLVCAGLAVFLFFGCKAATKATALLPKQMILGIKNRHAKQEEAL